MKPISVLCLIQGFCLDNPSALMRHFSSINVLLNYDPKLPFFLPRLYIIYSMNNHKCPRCSGKMCVDPHYQDEAYCVVCGYVEYFESVSAKFPPNALVCEEA